MKEVRTEILIEAPVEVVWKVFVDFESFGAWNEIMTVKGLPELGERLVVNIQIAGRNSTFKPKVTVVEEERKLEWRGSLGHKRIFAGDHFFHFDPEGEGLTRLIHGEHFSGVFSRPILRKIGVDTQAGFEAFNRAIKERSEALVI